MGTNSLSLKVAQLGDDKKTQFQPVDPKEVISSLDFATR